MAAPVATPYAGMTSAPVASTQSMPFIPTYGYGIAAVTGKAIEYGNDLELKRRQMAVNEAAEKATAGYYASIEGDISNRQMQAEALAKSKVAAHDVLGTIPDAPPKQDPNLTSPYPVPASSIPGGMPLPPGAVGQQNFAQGGPVPAARTYGAEMLSQPEVKKSLTAEEDVKETASAPGKGNPITMGSAIQSGEIGPVPKAGAQAVRVHTVPGGRPVTSAGTGPLAPGQATAAEAGYGIALNPAQMQKLGTGDYAVPPSEGAGFLKASEDLKAQAVATTKRLNEALKVIDQKYGTDSTYATYLKSNLIAAVDPKVTDMNTQASTLATQGMIANHMQDGAVLGGRIMARLHAGGQLDKSFLEDPVNAKLIKSLGANIGELAGMHLATSGPVKGFIVNAGGFVIPPKALAAASNFALPWNERYEKWNDITEMYKAQMTAKAEMIRAANGDPKQMALFVEGKLRTNLTEYSDMRQRYDSAENILRFGGKVKLKNPDTGKDEVVTVPSMKPGIDPAEQLKKIRTSVFNPTDGVDPIHSRVAREILLPAERQMEIRTGVVGFYQGTIGKSSVHSGKDANEKRFEGDLGAEEKIKVYNAEHPPLQMK